MLGVLGYSCSNRFIVVLLYLFDMLDVVGVIITVLGIEMMRRNKFDVLVELERVFNENLQPFNKRLRSDNIKTSAF